MSPFGRRRQVPRWVCCGLAVSAVTVVLLSIGCPADFGLNALPVNPFTDFEVIELSGKAIPLATTIVPLGNLESNQVLDIEVVGEQINAVLVLMADQSLAAAGVVAGGGPPNSVFQYRVPKPGRYFVFVLYDPSLDASQREGTIAVGPGDPQFQPPPVQPVRVVFSPDFLTAPGLTDPGSFTPDETLFIASISETIREGVVARLQEIFAGTPIEIFEGEPQTHVFSTVTILPDRVTSEESLVTDLLAGDSPAVSMFVADELERQFPGIQPPPPTSQEFRPFIRDFIEQDPRALAGLVRDSTIVDATRTDGSGPNTPDSCHTQVIFGTAPQDYGNQNLDDSALVFVGSFQGRGEDCHSAALNSINNIILGLSNTAAHEIGHLVGLFHVPITDIMFRTPTFAFQRELTLKRGQIEIDEPIGGGDLVPHVRTVVVQDPDLYFQGIFGQQ